jgi:hypothetical protein
MILEQCTQFRPKATEKSRIVRWEFPAVDHREKLACFMLHLCVSWKKVFNICSKLLDNCLVSRSFVFILTRHCSGIEFHNNYRILHKMTLDGFVLKLIHTYIEKFFWKCFFCQTRGVTKVILCCLKTSTIRSLCLWKEWFLASDTKDTRTVFILFFFKTNIYCWFVRWYI